MQTLINRLEQIARETGFSGVISMDQQNVSLFCQAYGDRDVKNQLLNTPTTRFGIASGTKLFTALGIGKLIDQGRISLQTGVGEIASEYQGFIDPCATILQLLTHTSGIYDYYDEEIEQDWDHFFVEIPWYHLETPSDYLPLFVNKPPKFLPGERYSYSNGGYVLLGMLIEKLTGQRYRDFIQEHILAPAGMTHSGFFALNDLPENTANGYLADRQTTNIYNLPIRGGGDGGMFTTAADLAAFWPKLLTGEILLAETTCQFLASQHKFDEQRAYGCGVYKRLEDRLYYILGGDAGVGFASYYQLPEQLTVSILSNISDGIDILLTVIREFFGW